jgi:hypothetical protein
VRKPRKPPDTRSQLICDYTVVDDGAGTSAIVVKMLSGAR